MLFKCEVGEGGGGGVQFFNTKFCDTSEQVTQGWLFIK